MIIMVHWWTKDLLGHLECNQMTTIIMFINGEFCRIQMGWIACDSFLVTCLIFTWPMAMHAYGLISIKNIQCIPNPHSRIPRNNCYILLNWLIILFLSFCNPKIRIPITCIIIVYETCICRSHGTLTVLDRILGFLILNTAWKFCPEKELHPFSPAQWSKPSINQHLPLMCLYLCYLMTRSCRHISSIRPNRVWHLGGSGCLPHASASFARALNKLFETNHRPLTNPL